MSVPELHYSTSCVLAVAWTNINKIKSHIWQVGRPRRQTCRLDRMWWKWLMTASDKSICASFSPPSSTDDKSRANAASIYHVFNCILKVEGGKTRRWHATNSHSNLRQPHSFKCLQTSLSVGGVWKVREVTFVFLPVGPVTPRGDNLHSTLWQRLTLWAALPFTRLSLTLTWTSVHSRYVDYFSLSLSLFCLHPPRGQHQGNNLCIKIRTARMQRGAGRSRPEQLVRLATGRF